MPEAPTRQSRKPSAAVNWIACFLVVFLVLFPKGGFRLVGIPLTWGYLMLLVLFPVGLVVRLLAVPLTLPYRVAAAIFLLLPMQALCVYAAVFNGIADLNFAISTVTGLFVLPWLFLLIFGSFYPAVDGDKLQRWFCTCVFVAALWGLFLFVLHPFIGRFIEIPYLTVNASDYGHLEDSKSIARGFFFKLISTYNNGNIYGVATLLLFPLYARLESSRFRVATVRLALLLTLARTVWVGIILNELLSLAPPLFRQIRTFPVLFLGEARRRFFAVAITAVLVFGSVFLVSLHGNAASFLFDRTLGNRTGEVTSASHPTFFPEAGLSGFEEVLYASAAQFWGLTGLFAFCLIMFGPLLITVGTPEIWRDPLRRAALKGLLVYTVMAAADGALNFIPVMAFYWFVYAVFLYGWPGRLHATARHRNKSARPRCSPIPRTLRAPLGT